MKGQTNRWIIGNSLQRKLRTHMTDAENCLWRHLRGRQMAGWKFRRQHPFLDYVLDFVCLEKRLVVEVDGGQHQDCEQDQVRDRRLHEAGFRVMRFWNNQVLQETEVVVEAIWAALHEESGDVGSLTTPSVASMREKDRGIG
jgi:very-short-patch-repair endonuclease